MEAKEGADSGVTVIGAEAPSNYHVATRVDNPIEIPGSVSVTTTTTPVTAGLTATTEKKKRGRPRKYGPDSKVPNTLSPTPISSSLPASGDYSSNKRGRGRGRGKGRGHLSSSDNQLQRISGVENLGDMDGVSAGTNFMPHAITVNTGEDVTMKIISFSQQGPRIICILSANGVISNVTLRQPDSCGGTLTYEGRFDILSLSGSFMPTENQGTRGRSGGMSVTLASPDGRVVGGSVAGLLVAASPVQVILGSFLPCGHLEQRPKKLRIDSARDSVLPITTTVAAAGPHTNAEKEDVIRRHGLQIRETSQPNHPDSAPTFREDWASVHPLQEPQRLATDINVSLPGC